MLATCSPKLLGCFGCLDREVPGVQWSKDTKGLRFVCF